jgi:ATP-binding cassette subfamily B multidrug efflux pump
LDDGKVVQRGKHEDLMKQEGYYKDMFEQQLSEDRNEVA